MLTEKGKKTLNGDLSILGIKEGIAHWNLSPKELAEITVAKKQGVIASNGALAVNTGEFTGRSPKDRFIVKDDITKDTVWWGDINIPFDPDKFDALYNKVIDYLNGKEFFVRDAYACADERYRMNLRVITEYPWSNLFAYNMFLRPTEEDLQNFLPDWHIVNAPGFKANPEIDGTRQHNFAIINFSKKILLIGGTGYTGEIKKGIFSALNFILPHEKNVLSMHCSANIGNEKNDTALFFGLSGTGKTTLSSDPNRRLIGDDEHGWTDDNVFNFEGGCYAKVINLSEEQEPQIFHAIKEGALLENVILNDKNEPDYTDGSITENTRVSYPIYYIDNIAEPSVGDIPKNIFFLTCDAFGVLPPISKLTMGQAMYHFISGYTAKVAGTEEGITEPQTTFSACFGAPFLPLHPTTYAKMLGEKMHKHKVNVWLVNTGWSGGPYGVGSRIKLRYTRAMITAALNGQLDNVNYVTHEIFGLQMPVECPDVPSEILNPRNTWSNKEEYDKTATNLAEKFVTNFKKFEDQADEETLAGAPKHIVNI